MKQIIVYTDQGVHGGALKQLICSLRDHVDLSSHRIIRKDKEALLKEDWEKDTALLIMPGGRDYYYQMALGAIGADRIRCYIAKGGNYLGICAGAYFASAAIEFEKGGALEVYGERSLKFFPGLAKGPAYGPNKFSYENLKGVEAAQVSWQRKLAQDESCHACIYYNGGCSFDSSPDFSSVEVMGRYLDLQGQPPAIVHCQVEKGQAILSGVHIEYSARRLRGEDPFIQRVLPQLKEAEAKRVEIFAQILSQLSISLKK